MRDDDTTLAAWSRTTTDIRKFASRANAIAASMMACASASEICAGVNGGGGPGACAKLAATNVSCSDRLAIASANRDERLDERKNFISSSRRLCVCWRGDRNK